MNKYFNILSMNNPAKKIKYDDLLASIQELLGITEQDKYSLDTVTKGLCETSLRGVDSHGVRFLTHYFNSVIIRRNNLRPKFEIDKKIEAFVQVGKNNNVILKLT